jgi:hypothetical protein
MYSSIYDELRGAETKEARLYQAGNAQEAEFYYKKLYSRPNCNYNFRRSYNKKGGYGNPPISLYVHIKLFVSNCAFGAILFRRQRIFFGIGGNGVGYHYSRIIAKLEYIRCQVRAYTAKVAQFRIDFHFHFKNLLAVVRILEPVIDLPHIYSKKIN